jgi:hypothetical protein
VINVAAVVAVAAGAVLTVNKSLLFYSMYVVFYNAVLLLLLPHILLLCAC